ncbi:NUDIX hydrolase [Lutibacter maritimus]|uniref:Isopentenyldiphosphate isomerase n=1 Tax=Lutibacter maritimus TaxID=593133 RepID=A0A1I6RWR3_9FLAO|nr:NUDIX domain-containing protein [Lutibacter maritimus]SFS69144.1 Isopentenyldiphosphate isomerase [Lutibacter maritimus]
MDEYIDILNDNGEISGKTCLKSEAHKKGLFHQSVHIWIVDYEKNVLIQKRAASKDVFPNLWDVSVAGHISAGEQPEISAIREIEEEIGLSVSKDELQYIGTSKKKIIHKIDLIDNELHHIYICRINFNFDTLRIQREEVSEIKTIELSNLIKEVLNEKNCFVPHGKDYYTFVFNELKML